MIAVGDTFDALTTNRPYQKAHDPVDALRIIENLSGTRLDPRAVTALMAVFYRGEIVIQKQNPQTIPIDLRAASVPAPHQPIDPLTIEISRT